MVEKGSLAVLDITRVGPFNSLRDWIVKKFFYEKKFLKSSPECEQHMDSQPQLPPVSGAISFSSASCTNPCIHKTEIVANPSY